MLLVIWGVLVLGSLVFKKSKIYSFLLIIVGISLFTYSYDNADSINYLISYNNLKSGNISVFSGNIFSNLLFYIAGLFNDFRLSRFLFSTISFFLIYEGGKRYTENNNVVLGLFLVAPFVIDATQIKCIISSAVWFYFSYYLYEAFRGNERRKNFCLYLVGVLISTGFHFSYALTAIYILVIFLDKKKIAIVVLGVNVLAGTTLGLSRINAIMDIIATLNHNYRNVFIRLRSVSVSASDFNYSFRIRTTLLFYLILLIVYLLLTHNNKQYDTVKRRKEGDAKRSDLAEFVFRLNILTIVYFPLMSISMQIYRIQRDLLLMDYTYLAILIKSSKKRNEAGRIMLNYSNVKILVIGLVLALYYLYFEALYGNIDKVFLPLFHMKR